MNKKMTTAVLILAAALNLSACGCAKEEKPDGPAPALSETTAVLETTEVFTEEPITNTEAAKVVKLPQNPGDHPTEVTEPSAAPTEKSDDPTEKPDTPTENPAAPTESPEKTVTLREYNAMTGEQQEAFYNSFASADDFFAWYNAAAEADKNNTIIVDGSTNIEITP